MESGYALGATPSMLPQHSTWLGAKSCNVGAIAVTVDGFLPVAAIIGGALVVGSLIYAILYGFHVKVIEKYGVWWIWPLLTLYVVCGAISFGCAALEWQDSPDRYGFYGDYDKDRRLWSFVLVGVLSILALVSARHAASAAKSAKAKS